MLIAAIIWACIVVAVIVAMLRAPEGYEDGAGFHYGPEPLLDPGDQAATAPRPRRSPPRRHRRPAVSGQ